jgi:hypothetical protein
MSKFLFLNFSIILSSKFYLTICRDIEKGSHYFPGKNKYCPFFKRMQLTCSAWVATNNTRDDSPEYPDKNMSLYYCVTFFPLVAICYDFRFNKPKVKYMQISNRTKHYKQTVLYHKQKP